MKGRKKTRATRKMSRSDIPMFKEPTPQERVKSAAKRLVETAVEVHPAVDSLAARLGRAARQGAGNVIRSMASQKKTSSGDE